VKPEINLPTCVDDILCLIDLFVHIVIGSLKSNIACLPKPQHQIYFISVSFN
jgi:hypothetical protein